MRNFENYYAIMPSYEKKRYVRLVRQTTRDRKSRRRGSFSCDTVGTNCAYYVVMKAHRRFETLAPQGISKILEIKNIEELRNQKDSAQRKLKEYAVVSGDPNYRFRLETRWFT